MVNILSSWSGRIRRVDFNDAESTAVAHRDSIESIGSGFYPPDVVEGWGSGLAADIYVKATSGCSIHCVVMRKVLAGASA